MYGILERYLPEGLRRAALWLAGEVMAMTRTVYAAKL
jgi:hypothetical protein